MEPALLKEVVPVAQWIARWTSNPKVPGSNPGRDASTFLPILLLFQLLVDSYIFRVFINSLKNNYLFKNMIFFSMPRKYLEITFVVWVKLLEKL